MLQPAAIDGAPRAVLVYVGGLSSAGDVVARTTLLTVSDAAPDSAADVRVETLELRCSAWLETGATDHPAQRALHGAVAFGDQQLMVFGGLSHLDPLCVRDDVAIFDMRTARWRAQATRGTRPSQRWGCTLHCVADAVVLTGGWIMSSTPQAVPVDEIWVLNLRSWVWDRLIVAPSVTRPLPCLGSCLGMIGESPILLLCATAAGGSPSTEIWAAELPREAAQEITERLASVELA